MGDQTTSFLGLSSYVLIKRMSENYAKGAERDDMYR